MTTLTADQVAALQCVALSDQTLCGPGFAGWPILVDANGVTGGLGFKSEAAFNETIAAVLHTQSSVFNDTTHSCPLGPTLDNAIAQMRYQASFLCVDAVRSAQSGMSGSVSVGKICPPPTTMNQDPGSVIMCGGYCKDAAETYKNVFTTDNCSPDPNWLNAKYNNRRSDCDAMTSSLTSSSSTAMKCWLGVVGESTTCGFANPSVAATFCQTSTDPCCGFFGTDSYAVWSKTANGWVYPSSSSGSTGVNKGVIFGAVAAAIVLITILGGAGYYYFKIYKPAVARSNVNKHLNYDVASHIARSGQQPSQLSNPSFSTAASQKQFQEFGYQQYGSYAPPSPRSNAATVNSRDRPHAHQQYLQQTQIPMQQLNLQTPPPPKQALPPSPSQEIVRIIHTYEAQMQDELTLLEGDDLILMKRFDDGWAQGVNPLTGAQGAFPLVCVCPLKDYAEMSVVSGGSISKDRLSKRMSSVVGSYLAPKAKGSSSKKLSGGKQTMRIMFPYKATQSDELDLEPGNDIIVIKKFDDGWALGMNPLTGQKGAFPLPCVEQDVDSGSQVSRLSRRASSLTGDWE